MQRGRIASFARRGLVAELLVWTGILIGVSFLASPARFQAPSLDFLMALDVGRHMFAALNQVEIALAVLSLGLAVLARPSLFVWALLVVVWLIVAAQGLWLLPALAARAAQIVAGATPPDAPWHGLYVALEAGKLLVLFVAATFAARRQRTR